MREESEEWRVKSGKLKILTEGGASCIESLELRIGNLEFRIESGDLKVQIIF